MNAAGASDCRFVGACALRKSSRVRMLSTSVNPPISSARVAASLERNEAMSRRTHSDAYYWPVVTVILVALPLYTFRDEESLLHQVFRVLWSVVLILSLVEIGRNLHKDLRDRREAIARTTGTRPPEEGL